LGERALLDRKPGTPADRRPRLSAWWNARAVQDWLLPFLAFLVLSGILTYPLIAQLADHLRDNGDSYEFAWMMGFGAYQLTHHPLQLFNGNIFYPFPLSLAYSESSIPAIVMALPVVLLTGNPVLGLNLNLFLTFVLSGFGTYLFVWQRTSSRLAGLVVGILYAFCPFRFDHLAQLSYASMQWAPFALWAFDRYLAQRRIGWAAATVGFTVLQVLVSFYYAFMLGFGIVFYVVAGLLARREYWRPAVVGPLLAAGTLGGLVLVPFVRPYFELNTLFDLHRTLQESEYFSAWPANYLAATLSMKVDLISPLLWLMYHRPWQLAPVGGSERHLYPGLLVTLLALVGLGWRRGGRVVAPVLMIVAGVVLSFGPVFHPSYDVVQPWPIPMPYTILFDYLPGFQAMRVPSRFAVLVILGLTILAGDGFAYLQRWLDRQFGRPEAASAAGPNADAVPPPAGATIREQVAEPTTQPRRGGGVVPASLLLALLCATIGVIEGLNQFATTPVKVGAAIPPVYRWLAANPTPGPIVELPIDDNAYRESPRSYYSTYHHRPTVDGFRSFIPPAYAPLTSALISFPAPGALNLLRRLAVRYVVVHEAEYPPAERAALRAGVRAADLQPVARFGSDVVYAVAGRAPPQSVRPLPLTPACLRRGQAGGVLDEQLTVAGNRPLLVLAPGSRSLDVALTFQPQVGPAYRETSRVAMPTWVLATPVELQVPFTAPPIGGAYAVQLSFPGQPGLTVTPAPQPRIAALVAPPPTAIPHLFQDLLLSDHTTPAAGVPYQLVWQVPPHPAHPLVVFVNVYDAQARYWSFATEREARFPSATTPTCPNGLTIAADTLHLWPNTPPGRYQVEAGLLDTVTGQRVRFLAPDGAAVTRVVLGSLWVEPPNVFSPGSLPTAGVPVATFGGAIALQAPVLGGSLAPGGTLYVTLPWHALQPTRTDDTAFVHLVDGAGKLVAQHDAQPGGSDYPTSAWQPGETVIESVPIDLPAILPPGPYHLEIGLYDLATGARLAADTARGQPSADHADVPVPAKLGSR
jgi:hypothetical protein